MAYSKTDWKNLPDKTTPITAENLNKQEQGIFNNDANITTIQSDITDINNNMGDLEDLETTNKDSLVEAINETHKNVVFSSDEKFIGTWLGQNLYRKVVTANLSITTAYGNFYLDIFDNVSEIDNCWIGPNGYIIDETVEKTEIVPLNFIYQGSSTFFSTVMTSIHNKRLRVHSSSERSNQTIVAEILYTKV